MALIFSQAKWSVILPPVGPGWRRPLRCSTHKPRVDGECKDDPVLRESRVRLYSAALST
jgi:hypothetical protein